MRSDFSFKYKQTRIIDTFHHDTVYCKMIASAGGEEREDEDWKGANVHSKVYLKGPVNTSPNMLYTL